MQKNNYVNFKGLDIYAKQAIMSVLTLTAVILNIPLFIIDLKVNVGILYIAIVTLT